jgi:hypothetical protein
MADYDLGTAHGKIRVDYEDKGFKAADKDMVSLMDRAKQMVRATAGLRDKWGKDFTAMTQSTTELVSALGVMSGALAFTTGMLSRAGMGMNGLRGATNIVSSLSLAMGGVPAGAENFPSVIKKVIQMAAAIALFRTSMFLLAGLAMRFRRLAFAAPLLRGLGNGIFALSGPLQLVSRLALDVAFAIREFRLVKQISKWVLGATTAFAALGGVIYLIVGLANAVQQLSGLIGLLPGLVLAAGVAFGVAKIALSGFMEAVKSGDVSKLPKEMADTVRAVRSFEGAWNEVKTAVQQSFFQGLGDQVKQVGEIYMPILKKGLSGVAGGFNLAAQQVAAYLKTSGAQTQVTTAIGLTERVVRNLAMAVAPLIQAFLDIANVGLSVFAQITAGAGKGAQGFADMVREAKNSGAMYMWIQRGVQALKDLWTFAKAVSRTLTTIFDGLSGNSGKSFLKTLADGALKMEAFFKSADGQRVLSVLGDLIAKAVDNLKQLGDVFASDVMPVIERFLPVLQALSDAVVGGVIAGIKQVAPIFMAIGTALGPIAPLLGFILKGMVATVVVILGLVAAFKILAAVFLILNSGLRAVRGAFMVAGFAARLFTGRLTAGERAVFRFMWALIKSIGRGIKTWIVGLFQGIWANAVWLANVIKTAVVTAATWLWMKVQLVALWLMIKIQALAAAIWVKVVWLAQTIALRAQLIALWIAVRVGIFATWIWLKIQAAIAAAQVALSWLVSTIALRAQLIALWLMIRIQMVAGWLLLKIQAAIAAAQVALSWLISTIALRAQLIALWLLIRVQMIAGWVVLKIQAALAAAQVALSWLVSTIALRAQLIALWVMIRVQMIIGWVVLKVQAALAAAQVALAWLASTIALRAQLVALWIMIKVQIMAQWLIMKIQAGIAALQVGLAWLASTISTTASMIGAWLSARIAIIGHWIAMRVAAMASAIQMAAAWFIALGPIGWVIAAVVGLVILIIANWETVKSVTIGVFTAIGSFFSDVWNNITGFFRDAMTNIGAALAPFQGIIDYVLAPLRVAQEVIGAILAVVQAIFSGNFAAIGGILQGAGQRILGIIRGAMSGMGSAVSSGISTVLGWFGGLPGRAMAALGNLAGTFARAGVNMIAGIVNGLSSAAGRVISFLTGLAQRALNSVLSFFGISSPSKVFIWVAEMMGAGWIKGLRSATSKVADAAHTMSEKVRDAVNGPMFTAAKEILDQMNKGKKVFEDFSFKGMSTNVAEYNDALVEAMKKSGIKDPKLFLEGYIASATAAAKPDAAKATPIPPPKWDPFVKATGGDGAVAPVDMSNMSVTIPAKDIAEMQSVTQFFEKVQQTARAGKAGG